MVKIAICDDEPEICQYLEHTLADIFKKLPTKYEIDIFHTGDELCQKIETKTHYDLIFLDIQLAENEINGVEVGRFIRDTHNNNTVSIVCISWKHSHAMQLFKIRPLDFLIKPLEYDQIEQAVKTHLKLTGLSSRVLIYKQSHTTHKVPIKDIIYLENRGRKVVIHLASGKEKEFYGSLKDVYNDQLFFFDFLFIHASFAVNYDYVTEAKYTQLLVADSQVPLSISRNRRNEVREHYLAIIKRRRGLAK